MKNIITKHDWLAGQQCLSMAWYALRSTPTPPEEAELFRRQQGRELGALARKLYPNGALVVPGDGQREFEITGRYIADRKETIFEAEVEAKPFVAKADILMIKNGSWHVIQVNSRFSDTHRVRDLVDDLAYTMMVLKRAGMHVHRASVLLLSRTYRFGDDLGRLFDLVDQTAEVEARAAEFCAMADSRANILFQSASPTPKLVPSCRECAVFSDKCIGAGIAHTVLEIPGLHYKKLARLSEEGIVDLSLVPSDMNLNERQQRAVDCAISGKLSVDAGLAASLKVIAWPCHYLDFETVATTLPLYQHHGCHQQVLTQFSIHRRDRLDAELQHCEYLADTTKDCQRELAETLIAALDLSGSIMVYSSFEKTRIKALQDLFPDLTTQLQTIVDRFVDLLAIIGDHVYHPDFRGSVSIKKVLPALVPALSYKDLAIQDGEMAITRFARMARGEIVGEEIQITRRQLLDYCKRDTLAMVRLHEALVELASVPPRFATGPSS